MDKTSAERKQQSIFLFLESETKQDSVGQILPLGGKRALNSWAFPEFQRTNLTRDMRQTQKQRTTVQQHKIIIV